MKNNRLMQIIIILSFGALVLFLMPADKTRIIDTAVLLVFGIAWIIWKKPAVKETGRKQFTLCLALLFVAFCALRFYKVWMGSYRIRVLAELVNIKTDVLVTAADCTLSLCALLFIFLLFQKIEQLLDDLSEKRPFAEVVLLAWLAAAVTAALSQRMCGADFLSMGLLKFFCGSVFVAAIVLLLYCLCGKARISVAVGTGMIMLLSTVNAYVYKFRYRLFEPADFFSVGTAMNVADNYNLWPVPLTIILSWVFWIVFLSFLFTAEQKNNYKVPWKKRLLISACCIISIAFTAFYSSGLEAHHWQNEGAQYNGYVLDFVSKIKDTYIAVPEGYSEETVSLLAEKYTADQDSSLIGTKPPHIIVIMDEAFSDLGVLGDFKTSTQVMPFIDSLKENAITGNVLVSVYGGNTANSEFEFLTGHTMAWFSPNAVPFEQHLHSDAYSMVSYLKSGFGYRCIAMHPYESSGWNRPAAYKAFGFDESLFMENFPRKDYIRAFISDREMFETIAATYEKQHERPLFLFGISMQNHGGYNYSGSNYEQTVFLKDFEHAHKDAEQYLSLIHETDKAVECLISYFSNVDDEVVIVFFGDHQPRLEDGFYRELGLDNPDSLNDRQKFFEVPFFIWTNFNTDAEQVDLTGLNYLSSYVYRAAGLPLPPYNKFLSEMEQMIPALNANGLYSKRAETFLHFDEASAEERAFLADYQILQYNSLFDEQDRNEAFFPVLQK